MLVSSFFCVSHTQSLFGGIERDSYGFTRRSTRGSDSTDYGGDDDDADGGGLSQSASASGSHSAAPEVNWEPQRRLWNSYLALHPRVSKDDSELKVGFSCNALYRLLCAFFHVIFFLVPFL